MSFKDRFFSPFTKKTDITSIGQLKHDYSSPNKKLFDTAKNQTSNNQLAAPSGSTKPDKSPLRHRVKNRNYRIDLLLKAWRNAVDAAEYEIRPDRRSLYQIYHQCTEDGFIIGQIRTAIFNVQMAPFCIERNGNVDEESEKLFQTPWFYNMLEHVVQTEMYGHSLVEFFKGKDKLVSEVHLIPRVHVRPEHIYGDVLLQVSDTVGISFRTGPVTRSTIEIGDEYSLGLMKQISKLIIEKGYSRTDWIRRNERFGMPFITVTTATRDEEELNQKENMLKNFGSNSYAILDDQDEIKMLEPVSNTGGGHVTFKALGDELKQEISILVNGQTGTTEEKAHVGSAEVHERQLNKYTLARLTRTQLFINFKLIPFLIKNYGYPLQNCEFKFKDLIAKDAEVDEDSTPTAQSDKNKDPEQDDAKKKS